jgi:hypothetical protein
MERSNHATVGCTFSSDEAIVDALRALASDGAVTHWRVGATDKDRAMRVATAAGASGDLDPVDPLNGVTGLASSGDAAKRVNKGALFGGAVGAVVGAVGGHTAFASIMPVEAPAQPIAATLLFFVLGIAVGGVLGGAIGKRSSTHAGFRLIDAMEAGDVAAIGDVDGARVDDVRRALDERGAAEIVVIAG